MARYIDAEKISNHIRENFSIDKTKNADICFAFIDFMNWLDELPTADVEEVKHAEWKHECLECSVCKRNISEIYDADSYMASGIEQELLFCPFCGAKMDGGKEE